MPWKDERASCQKHFPESRSSWVCRTEPSNLAALCSEFSFEGWVHPVSDEGSLPSLLCAHMLEKEKALVSSSYEGIESMVSEPYP